MPSVRPSIHSSPNVAFDNSADISERISRTRANVGGAFARSSSPKSTSSLARITPQVETANPISVPGQRGKSVLAKTIREIDAAKHKCFRQLEDYQAIYGLAEIVPDDYNAEDVVTQTDKATHAC